MPPDGYFGVRAYARWVIARHMALTVEGLEHVPATGPALLVARHYHHLYDGAALVGRLRRPVRIVVGLDWAAGARQRAIMERLCKLARWPVALRADGFRDGTATGYARREAVTYLRRALDSAARLLTEGELVAMFPEGYPNVDPMSSRKAASEWLPFAPGFLAIAERAQRAGVGVPLIPVGFTYGAPVRGRTPVTMRIGPAYLPPAHAPRAELSARLESAVRALSG